MVNEIDQYIWKTTTVGDAILPLIMADQPQHQHDPAYLALIQQLHALRIQAGHTQHDLAKALNLTLSTIQKIEHGQRRIDIIEFIHWCQACQADPGQVLDQIESG